MAYNKNKLYKAFKYWSWDTINFNFSEESGTSSSTTFCVWFSKKNISHVILYELTKFHCLIAFTSRDLDSMCITIANQTVTSSNLKLTLSFLSSHFATWPKSQDKSLISLGRKELLRWKKAFFIIFKGFCVAKNCIWPESAPLRHFRGRCYEFLHKGICWMLCGCKQSQWNILALGVCRTSETQDVQQGKVSKSLKGKNLFTALIFWVHSFLFKLLKKQEKKRIQQPAAWREHAVSTHICFYLLPPHSGSVDLRQLNPIHHKKGP